MFTVKIRKTNKFLLNRVVYYRIENNQLVKYEDASFTKVAKAGIVLTTAATYFVRKIAPSITNAYKQALCSLK